ncbi:hypothetical protein GCM10009813_05390 [Brevibacterium marinum]
MMFTFAIFGSFILYLVIGAVVGRKVKNTSDYYVAGRAAPTLLIAGTLVASFLSTVSFMGELGFSYDGYPVPMLFLTLFNVCGYVVGVLFFGRYLRRSQALTVPEYFGKRFDSKAVQAIAGAMVVVGIGLYLVAVTQGLVLVLVQLTGLNETLLLVIVWASYTLFTMLSGSQGVLVNDTLMFFVFTVASVLGMGYVLIKAGGPGAAIEKLSALAPKPDGLAWHGMTGEANYMGSHADIVMYCVTLGLVWATVVAVSPWQSSRFLMAKNEHVCIRSGVISMAVLAAIYLFLTFGGFAINAFNPAIDPSEVAFIWTAQNVMPPVVGVIAVTGIVAAGLSSAASFLSLIGFSTANDILPVLLRRGTTSAESVSAVAATTASHNGYASHDLADVSGETVRGSESAEAESFAADEGTRGLWASRITMFVVGLIVLAITAVASPAVLTIGYFAATLFAASWGPIAFWSVRSERLTARGAGVGMICGFLVVGVLNSATEFAGLTLPTILDPVILGFLASIVGTWAGNIGQVPSEAGNAFRRTLLAVPDEDRDPKDLKLTKIIMAICGIGLVFCSVVMVVLYAIPYSGAS